MAEKRLYRVYCDKSIRSDKFIELLVAKRLKFERWWTSSEEGTVVTPEGVHIYGWQRLFSLFAPSRPEDPRKACSQSPED